MEVNGPLYLYHKGELCKQINKLNSLTSVNKIAYAMKSNSNQEILELIYNKGFSFDCVSIQEVKLLKKFFRK